VPCDTPAAPASGIDRSSYCSGCGWSHQVSTAVVPSHAITIAIAGSPFLFHSKRSRFGRTNAVRSVIRFVDLLPFDVNTVRTVPRSLYVRACA
jgi:hypothetical protein